VDAFAQEYPDGIITLWKNNNFYYKYVFHNIFCYAYLDVCVGQPLPYIESVVTDIRDEKRYIVIKYPNEIRGSHYIVHLWRKIAIRYNEEIVVSLCNENTKNK